MLKKIFNILATSLRRELEIIDKTSTFQKELQISLKLQYQALKHTQNKKPRFRDIGFRVFSQNDEDGILLYIFSIIGVESSKCVEICCGDGIECNSANLIIHHGWHGLLIDGNENKIKTGKLFYKRCKDTWLSPPVLINSWVTRENVNDLIIQNNFSGDIDLLSLDLDGIDYWIWDAINCISPRVVVLEYHNILGPEKSITVPYKPDFDRFKIHPEYLGASLTAFVKLGRKKGYRLIGVNKYEFNAFFVKNDIANDFFPEMSVLSCFSRPQGYDNAEKRYYEIKDFEWVEV